MVNTALIDADILVWLASYKKDHIYEAYEFIDEKLKEIVTNTKASHYKFFLTGSGNYRYFIRDDYKAHRKHKEKPEFFDDVREYFIREMNAFVSKGCEADDVIVATAKYLLDSEELGMNPIICSIDKDFMIKPYTLYKWKREAFNKDFELIDIDDYTAFYNLCKMMLVGDRGDNIITCDGIGDKKAEKILGGSVDDKPSRYTMMSQIVRTYKKFYGYKWRLRLEEVYKLINLNDNYEKIKIPTTFEFAL